MDRIDVHVGLVSFINQVLREAKRKNESKNYFHII